MYALRRLVPYLLVLMLAGLAVTSCASAPVQEMSDARQALQAAEEVGAPTKATSVYTQARELLEQAERELQEGDYKMARKHALEAKEHAIHARERSVTEGPNH